MDVYCPVCGEPWDMGELHELRDWLDEPMEYAEAWRQFKLSGCEVFGVPHAGVHDEQRANLAEVLYDIVGDDIDCTASMLDDLGED